MILPKFSLENNLFPAHLLLYFHRAHKPFRQVQIIPSKRVRSAAERTNRSKFLTLSRLQLKRAPHFSQQNRVTPLDARQRNSPASALCSPRALLLFSSACANIIASFNFTALLVLSLFLTRPHTNSEGCGAHGASAKEPRAFLEWRQ